MEDPARAFRLTEPREAKWDEGRHAKVGDFKYRNPSLT